MIVAEWRFHLIASGYSAEFLAESAEILEGIEKGIDIEFSGERNKNRTCHNLKTATDDPEVEEKVSKVIADDVLTGKKAGPFDSPPFPFFSASPIGAVPKKGSKKIRVIHHLSYPVGGDSINNSVADKYQPLGDFEAAAEIVRKYGRCCWLIKLDVEAAYKQVPVRIEDWPLLGFKWKGKYYYERVLPFGLKSSCRKWELYATALHYFLQKIIGIEGIVHYIDDFLFVVESKGKAETLLTEALALCARLGLPMAAAKTEGPTHKLTFLGIDLDTEAMTATLPAEKLAALRQLCVEWEGKKCATQRELQSLAGILNFACYVIRPGRAYKGRIIQAASAYEEGDEKSRRVPAAVLKDIRWWRDIAPQWNGVSLLYQADWIKADLIELYTDACGSGFGAMFGSRYIYGAWTKEQLQRGANGPKGKLNMPFMETLSLVTAASTWGHLWTGKRITFRSDCIVSVYAINNQYSKSDRIAGLVRHFSALAIKHRFDFRCIHVAGVTNIDADLLSRKFDPSRTSCSIQEFKQRNAELQRFIQPTADVTIHLPPLHQL